MIERQETYKKVCWGLAELTVQRAMILLKRGCLHWQNCKQRECQRRRSCKRKSHCERFPFAIQRDDLIETACVAHFQMLVRFMRDKRLRQELKDDGTVLTQLLRQASQPRRFVWLRYAFGLAVEKLLVGWNVYGDDNKRDCLVYFNQPQHRMNDGIRGLQAWLGCSRSTLKRLRETLFPEAVKIKTRRVGRPSPYWVQTALGILWKEPRLQPKALWLKILSRKITGEIGEAPTLEAVRKWLQRRRREQSEGQQLPQ